MTEGMKVRLGAGAIWVALLAIALLLTGCATGAVQDRIVEVKVPVAVQPIKPEQIPPLPQPLPPRPSSLSAAADILLAKVCQWVAYGIKVSPLLDVSAGQQPKAVLSYPECGER